jgi:serine/threonine protein kinase
MEDDNHLIDAETGEPRFRVGELVASGRTYQIVLAEDTEAAGRQVCLKAVHYDEERAEDPEYVDARRGLLEQEHAFLEAVDDELLPRTLGMARVTSPQAGFEDEPVLVYEYRPGVSLFEWVRAEHPEGVAPEVGLGMLRRLVEFLIAVHRAGWIFRDLDPRHLIVDDDGELCGVVGAGNATAKGQRPEAAKMVYDEAVYVAPEARAERSGKMLRPSADCYGLGALLSFVLTGEEPRAVVENPLSWPAYERLSNLEPPGAALVVARCIQPLAKKRFGRLERLQPYLTPDGLPTAQTEGFGMLLLPAPFSGVEDPENNRSLKSKLSAGPLISVGGQSSPDELAEPAGLPLGWALGALAITVGVVALMILSGLI